MSDIKRMPGGTYSEELQKNVHRISSTKAEAESRAKDDDSPKKPLKGYQAMAKAKAKKATSNIKKEVAKHPDHYEVNEKADLSQYAK